VAQAQGGLIEKELGGKAVVCVCLRYYGRCRVVTVVSGSLVLRTRQGEIGTDDVPVGGYGGIVGIEYLIGVVVRFEVCGTAQGINYPEIGRYPEGLSQGIEQSGKILKRCAAGKGQFHYVPLEVFLLGFIVPA
jgi:hypothetical protein